MKNQNLISVVIPVYNTRKIHIEECLDRVLHQTYKNIEVMVIDDGSRRVLARHLDNISKKDKRIKVIHQQNTGTNRARQIGFIKSTGSYVTFVDSDDLIEKSMISRLLQACLDNEADMSICEYWDDVNTKKTPNPWTNSQDVLDGKDAISRCRYAGFPKMRHVGAVWARMYKRSILEKIDWDFSDYTVTEDEFMNIQIFANANKAVCIPRQLYYYRQQVATSKEMNYPAHNTRKGQKIPMLQTASDLYEKSKQVYGAKNIKYNEIELTQNYIAILGKQADQLMGCGNFDEDNQQELLRQKSRYLPAILRNKKLTDRQKLLAIITFDSPGSISLLNKVEQQYINQINEHNKEITSLKGTLSRLRAENEQFLDVVRSTKLLAGNIKRKLRARTKNSKIIK